MIALIFLHHVSPGGSPNLDEIAYEQQASALAHGHLTLSGEYASNFRPYLSDLNDDGQVVFKYQPVWPALMALARTLGLGTVGLRLVLAALTPAVAAWVAREAVGRRRVAELTAGFIALCPMVWAQSSSLLAYHPSLLLLGATVALMMRAVRTAARPAAIVAGVAAGISAFHRSFDAAVVIGATAVGLLLTVRPARRVLSAAVPFATAASIGPLVIAGYNRLVTGSFTRLPFDLAGGKDRFGFGQRASFSPSGVSGGVDYTLGTGLEALVDNLVQLRAWGPLGLASVALAIVGTRARCPGRVVLLVQIVLVPLAYVLWWGTANLTDFNLHRLHGPSYHYFLVIPLAIIAATGTDALIDRWRAGMRRDRWLCLIPVALLVPSGMALWSNLRAASQASEEREVLLEAIERAGQTSVPGEQAVVLVSPARYLGEDFVYVEDPFLRYDFPDLVGTSPLVGVDLVGTRLAIADRFSDRAISVLDTADEYGTLFEDRDPPAPEAVRLERITGSRIVVTLSPTGTQVAGVPFLADDSGILEILPAPAAGPVTITLSAGSWRGSAEVSVGFLLAESVADDAIGDEIERISCTLELRDGGDQLTVVTPCRPSHRYVFPDGRFLDAVERVPLAVTVEAMPP